MSTDTVLPNARGGVTASRAFGELLREHRLARGLAQESLAERAQISAVTISALERGARQKPYRDTIAQLAEALGLSPEDRAELERAATRRPGSGSPEQPACNLKQQRSSFVGREADVAKIKGILSSQRLLTLVGAGGVGKTRLALAVASELLDHSRHDIWFVDLSSVADGAMIPAAIASALGLERCRGLDLLIASLQRKSFLLLLDNCEHLIDGAASVADAVLHGCPEAQILITSRQALAVEGERIFRVSPLSVPRNEAGASLSVREAMRFGAIRLFSDRAEAADSRFELTEESLPPVMEICERLDGIALAIEIAAARSNVFSLKTIACQLQDHFLNLTDGARVPVPRHKTMQALFDWSYDLLDSNESALFRSLSIFVGGFTLELARTACASEEIGEDEVVGLLASLVDKSLVQGEAYSDTTRYRLLEPTRQFAREKLRERGEFSSVAQKHALALLARAERFDSMLEMVSDRVWDAEVEAERENFRAAFNWAFGPDGDKRIGQQLTASRSAIWHGHASGESRRWVRAALAGCDDATDPRVRAGLELAYARCASEYWQIPPREALIFAERALSLQHRDVCRECVRLR